ncbi:NAD(+)/NADH kinase [Desulforudis sp. 1088]|uniref:NAD(+)/NADH kinase n=1 Tax=unclassified Candidatus Desulforudis TaxID=2635950 RepID=UPI003CE4F5E7
MRKVGLIANRHLDVECVERIVDEIRERLGAWRAGLWIYDSGIPLVKHRELLVSELPLAEMVIALGGDGTMLGTARRVAPLDIPVLGVRMGRLGFLSEIDPAGVAGAVDRFFSGDYHLEQRSMLEAEIRNAQGSRRIGIALNDFVITKGTLLRPISTEVRVNGDLVTSYLGDGLIVATPTGSTAYSLAAGGPLLTPDVQGILITPLCAHSVVERSFVVGPSSILEARLLSAQKGAMLVADGQESRDLASGDMVVLRQAAKPALLVRFHRWSFFEVLRERLERRSP